jgi:hypothetical protein
MSGTEGGQDVADPSDPDGDARTGSTAGTPRWVKVFGVIALVVAVLFVVLALVGGGKHGPGRHAGRTSTHLEPASDLDSA